MIGWTVLFSAVYVVNVIPAFAPPTWMILSIVGLNYPQANVPVLAIVGASAATLGRFTLAKLSRAIIRGRLLSEGMRRNVDVIKDQLEHRRLAAVSSFFVYALSPFPSNYLFIAYGLTALNLWLVTIPFFVGRFLSYNFLVFSAAAARHHLELESSEAESYFGVYFVATQILLLAAVYAFAKVDWRAVFNERKLRWIKKPSEALSQ
jgi:membrane protein YqaA with SNARE-associated domain